MGIYNDGIIRGIKMSLYGVSCQLLFSYEKQYDDKMTIEQIREVEKEYNTFTDGEKQELIYNVYVNCSSTYDNGNFMHWWRISKDELEELFVKGDIRI
jgi:hypothetical protein